MELKELAFEVTPIDFLRMTIPLSQERVKGAMQEGLVVVMYVEATDEGINPSNSFILSAEKEFLETLLTSQKDGHLPVAYARSGQELPEVMPDLDIEYYIRTLEAWVNRYSNFIVEAALKDLVNDTLEEEAV